MHKIGIVSDTHGMLRPEVLIALEGCEVILHGGDINKQSILDRLAEIAPLYVVRGNNDKEWAADIPETLTMDVCGLHVFMVHNKKFIPKDLSGIDLVVYGHSHKYEDKVVEGIHYLNPGSCGPRRFNQEITLAILYLEDNGEMRVEKVLIPHEVGEKVVSGSKEAKAVLAGTSDAAEAKIPADIAVVIAQMMKEIDAGKSVKQMAKKHKISEELADQVTRMYVTHPGVNVDGILRRIGL